MTDDKTILICTGRSSRKKRYHTELCRGAKKANNLREVRKSDVEHMDLTLCTYCAGEHTTDNYNDSYQKALKQAAKVAGD